MDIAKYSTFKKKKKKSLVWIKRIAHHVCVY